jgi:FkbM family methyltransferase
MFVGRSDVVAAQAPEAPPPPEHPYPRRVTLNAEGMTYRFTCASNKEVRRVKRLFTKEPGTIDWLVQTLRPNDVFFDIGSNIGVYSIFAGLRLSGGGCVYAFEPHVANAASLLRNIEANNLLDRVKLVTVPLSDRDGFAPFHYHSLDASRSCSQFGAPVLEGERFEPVSSELKYGCRLDSLLASGLVPRPTVVKIDVDGLEAEIVAGMRSLLTSPDAPRSVQIEIAKDNADEIIREMAASEYQIVSRHWTQSKQLLIQEKGIEPITEFPQNIIFTKVKSPATRRETSPSLVGAK